MRTNKFGQIQFFTELSGNGLRSVIQESKLINNFMDTIKDQIMKEYEGEEDFYSKLWILLRGLAEGRGKINRIQLGAGQRKREYLSNMPIFGKRKGECMKHNPPPSQGYIQFVIKLKVYKVLTQEANHMQAQESPSSIGLLSQAEIERILMLNVQARCAFEITKNRQASWNSVKSKTAPCIVEIRADYVIQWDSGQKYVVGGKKLCYGQKIKLVSCQNLSKQSASKGNSQQGFEFIIENIHLIPGENQTQEFFTDQDPNSVTFFTNDFQVEIFLGILFKKPIIRQIQDLRYVFKPGKIIFNANQSKIYEASEILSKKIVAVKAYPKEIYYDPHCFEKIRRKILLLHSLKHENILSIDRVFCTRKSLYIQMEICQTNLEKVLEYHRQRLGNLKMVQLIMHQLIRGLSFLHSFHITHGNITASNVLLKNFNSNQIRVVLTGFSHFRCFELESKLIKNPENQVDLELKSQQLSGEENEERRKDMTQVGLILSNLLLIAKQSQENESNKFWYENNQQNNQQINNWIEAANQLLERIITSDFKFQLTAQQAVNHKLFSLQFNS